MMLLYETLFTEMFNLKMYTKNIKMGPIFKMICSQYKEDIDCKHQWSGIIQMLCYSYTLTIYKYIF